MLSSVAFDHNFDGTKFRFNAELAVEYESDIAGEYTREIAAVESIETAHQFARKWSALVPECEELHSITSDEFPALRSVIDDARCGMRFLNVRLPPSLLRISMLAAHFGVPDGVIVLQLLRTDGYIVTEHKRGDLSIRSNPAVWNRKENSVG